MKALTVSQPYADKFFLDERDEDFKFVENRSRRFNYRGPLAIHAGKGTQYLSRQELTRYVTGAVIGIVTVVDCIDIATAFGLVLTGRRDLVFLKGKRTIEEIVGHKHTSGPFALVLEDPIKFPTPLPAVGKLGLWEWDPTPRPARGPSPLSPLFAHADLEARRYGRLYHDIRQRLTNTCYSSILDQFPDHQPSAAD